MQFGEFMMRFASVFDPKGVDAAISATEKIRTRLSSLQKAFDTISGRNIVDPKAVSDAEKNLDRLVQAANRVRAALSSNTSSGGSIDEFKRLTEDNIRVTSQMNEARRVLEAARAGSPVRSGATFGQYAGNIAGSAIAGLPGAVGGLLGGSFSTAANVVGIFEKALAKIPNPLNAITNALKSVDAFVHKAFDAAFFGAFMEIGRGITDIFFGWLNALIPVQPVLQGISKIVMSLTPMGALGEGGFARIETQLKGLQMTAANTGVTAKDLNSALVAIRTTGIQAGEAIKSVSQGMQAGISTRDVQRLARGAQDLAQISGETSTDSFQRLFRAVTTGNTEILRTVGIMKTQDQFINDFAMKTGRTYDEIRNSQTLLRQAFIEGILKETTKYAGAYDAAMETVSKRLNSLKRLIDDFTTSASQMFTPLLSGAVGVIEKGLDTLTGVFLVTKKQSQDNAASMIRDQYGISDAAGLTADNISKLTKLSLKSQTGKPEDQKALDDYTSKLVGQAQAAGLAGDKLAQYDAYLRQMTADIRDGKESFEALGGAMQPTQFNLFLQAISRVAGRGMEAFGLDFVEQFLTIDAAAKDFAENAPEKLALAAEKFSMWFAGILQSVMDFGAKFGEYVTNLINAPIQAVQDFGSQLSTLLVSGIQGAISAASGALTGLANSLKNGFLDVIRFLAGQTKKEFETLYKDIGDSNSKADTSLPIRVEPKIRVDAKWGENLNRQILDNFRSEDFEQYNFLGGFVEKILGNEGAALEQVEKFRSQLLQALDQIRTGGDFDQGLFAPIMDAGGNDVLANVRPMLVEYLNLWKLQADEVRRQKEEQKELEQMTFRLQAAQERLRQFERGTQDIPVRYTRARKDQLQAEIDAMNRERELMEQKRKERQWDVQERQRQFTELKETLQEALRLAQATGQIELFKFKSEVPQIDTTQFVADFEAKVKDMANRIGRSLSDAFKPARMALLEFMNFLGGAVGGADFKPITLDNIKAPELGDFQLDDGSYDFEAYNAAIAKYKVEQAGVTAENAKINERFTQGLKLHGDLLTIIGKVKDVWGEIVKLITRAVELVGAFAAGLTGGTLSKDIRDGAQAGDPDAQRQASAFSAGQGLAAFGRNVWDSLPEPVRKLLTDFKDKPIDVIINGVVKGFDALADISKWLLDTFAPNGKIEWGKILTLGVALSLLPSAINFAGLVATTFGGAVVKEGGKWVFNIAGRIGSGILIETGAKAALQTFSTTALFAGIKGALTTFITVTLPAWGTSLATALSGIVTTVLASPILLGLIIGFLANALIPEEWKRKFREAFFAGVDAWKVIINEQFPIIAGLFPGFLMGIVTMFTTWVGDTVAEVVRFKDEASKSIGEFVSGAQTKFADVKKDVVEKITSAFDTVKTTITGLPAKISSTLESIKTKIASPFETAKTAIGDFITKITSLSGIKVDLSSVSGAFKLIGDAIKPIVTAAQGMADIFKKIFDGIIAKAANMSTGTRVMLNTFATSVTAIFGKLFDTLLGHSIIPDITDGITGEFGALTDRNKGGLGRFANMVENNMANINTALDIPGLSGSINSAAGAVARALEVNINQSGWVFPANMSPEQMEALRILAREETYSGIVAAFEGTNV